MWGTSLRPDFMSVHFIVKLCLGTVEFYRSRTQFSRLVCVDEGMTKFKRLAALLSRLRHWTRSGTRV